MSRELPRCYGSHERGHADCGDCLVEDDCEIETQAGYQAAERRRRMRDVQVARAAAAPAASRTTTTTTNPTTGVRTQMDHDHGFFHAVGYNSILEAITAMFSEGWRSMREVPRLDYKSVWDRKPPPKRDEP